MFILFKIFNFCRVIKQQKNAHIIHIITDFIEKIVSKQARSPRPEKQIEGN